MNSRFLALLAALVLSLTAVTQSRADGLIHKLPAEGTWVRFDATGEGVGADGKVTVTVKGTMTLKSVGKEQVDGVDCRWIELETAIEIERTDGRKGKQTETLKLLIPEKNLKTGENPRAHVLKAWRKREGQPAVELDMKGAGAREIESLDELFHGGLAKSEKKEGVEIKVPGGTFKGTTLTESETSPAGDADLKTSTSLTDEVPFGVAAYRHSKMRKRGNDSLGGRWMELKFAATGKDAKSEIEK